uniref:Ribonuclease T2, like n=1 Tax=Gasterosteus aculeatus aculeatus TaxID=481459 RepID=A0AAQ4S953_GASAC
MWRTALPLLVGLSPAVVFLLQLPDYTATQEGPWQDYKHGRQGLDSPGKKPFCSWKCLLFTLQWPGAFCQSLDKETLCKIPPSINNWTIHGLWPQKVGRCCSCWPMFQSDVQELDPELNQHWPSLLKTQPSFHFWKQEWEKHGVCAACVEGMNSPLRYFQISLKLRGQFDIQRLLQEAGINPSCERPYKLEEVHPVLAPHLGDKHEVQCVTGDQTPPPAGQRGVVPGEDPDLSQPDRRMRSPRRRGPGGPGLLPGAPLPPPGPVLLPAHRPPGPAAALRLTPIGAARHVTNKHNPRLPVFVFH